MHEKTDGYEVGQHPLVSRLLKKAFNHRPPRPRYEVTWDVSIVLNYIESLGESDSLSLQGRRTLLLAFPVWTVLPDLLPETPPLPECVCNIAGLALPDQQIWMVWSMPESWPVSM